MSPEETVRYYFEKMGQKDKKAMDDVLSTQMKNTAYDFNNLESISLTSCEETRDSQKVNFNYSWYPEASKVTAVTAVFEARFSQASSYNGIKDGSNSWLFYLAKNKDDADWVIVYWTGE